MLNFICHQGNAIKTQRVITSKLLRWLLSKWQGITRAWECGEKGTLVHCWWECKFTATVGNCVEVPQKIKNRTTISSQHLGIYSKEMKLGYQRDSCTVMFTATLFTTSKIGKQPKCPCTDEWIKKIWYTHTHTQTHKILLFCHRKEGISSFCNNMGGPWGHYAKWNKSCRKRHLLHDVTYM